MIAKQDMPKAYEMAALLGGQLTPTHDGLWKVVGIDGIGPRPMPLIQATERLRERIDSKISAAILGFRGAIRCCRAAGIDEYRVFKLVQENGVADA